MKNLVLTCALCYHGLATELTLAVDMYPFANTADAQKKRFHFFLQSPLLDNIKNNFNIIFENYQIFFDFVSRSWFGSSIGSGQVGTRVGDFARDGGGRRCCRAHQVHHAAFAHAAAEVAVGGGGADLALGDHPAAGANE